MLKFRSLTAQELAELETEFKQFLILNELYDANGARSRVKTLPRLRALSTYFQISFWKKPTVICQGYFKLATTLWVYLTSDKTHGNYIISNWQNKQKSGKSQLKISSNYFMIIGKI